MKLHAAFTAEIVALARAAGNLETDPRVGNADHLASRLLRPTWRLGLLPGIRTAMRTIYGRLVPGMYYYHQARTRHIDSIVLDEADRGLRQFVILGAGLDSRAYRFSKELSEVRVFEVDHPLTSASKQERLARAALQAAHIRFVPTDFTRDALCDRLAEAGLDSQLRTLFLCEGLIYYLPERAVHQTLEVISEACRGSVLVFDYVMDDCIVHPQEHYGAAEFFRYVAGKREPVRFGIAPSEVPTFLRRYQYAVQSEVGPRELSDRYLMKADGAAWGSICDIFRIVRAAHE